jgi:uncharacterized protein YbcC (UPF0753/DUF2309 family)
MIYNPWNKVSPFWPLQNLAACNPFWGYIDREFDQVLTQDIAIFKIEDLPKNLEDLNMHSIKYLQAFFDNNQAAIVMPNKKDGLLKSAINLLIFDNKIKCRSKKQKIQSLPKSANQVVDYCLNLLKIPEDSRGVFLEILIVTLYGWASFIKYKSEWETQNLDLQQDFLALRILIFTLISNNWHSVVALAENTHKSCNYLEIIKSYEEIYKEKLFQKLSFQKSQIDSIADAQFIFCIDIRSEPLRRQIEKMGNYETFSFAGFFGTLINVKNHISEEIYSICPVLLRAEHQVNLLTKSKKCIRKKNIKKYFKYLYSNFKYNFTTPLLLVDFLGIFSAFVMLKKLLKLNKKPHTPSYIDISDIPLSEKIRYAKGLLNSIGLTKNFSKTIIICGHGSHTTNNSFATILDCGACGGRHGGDSARIVTEILNDSSVRNAIRKDGILIEDDITFIAALHNTTTNEVIYYNPVPDEIKKITSNKNIYKSLDWSETRPEWGLAKNASFIIGPRSFTKNINLDTRSFLHSYDYTLDSNGEIITQILTGPMIVAHWINSQYLFSTIDNIAFGAGSKVTQNITGKAAIIQGNASDIMHGLPMQSLFINDSIYYHEPLRLTTIIYGSKDLISNAIKTSDILQKLFANQWVFLVCFDIESKQRYFLDNNLEWQIYEKQI